MAPYGLGGFGRCAAGSPSQEATTHRALVSKCMVHEVHNAIFGCRSDGWILVIVLVTVFV